MILAALLTLWGFVQVGRPKWPAKPFVLDYVVWERDRVLALAKGTASASVGFLSALVVALLKQEIKSSVPGVAVLGCVLGCVGLLIFAAKMSMGVHVNRALK
jgi:hypothetical protein